MELTMTELKKIAKEVIKNVTFESEHQLFDDITVELNDDVTANISVIATCNFEDKECNSEFWGSSCCEQWSEPTNKNIEVEKLEVYDSNGDDILFTYEKELLNQLIN